MFLSYHVIIQFPCPVTKAINKLYFVIIVMTSYFWEAGSS